MIAQHTAIPSLRHVSNELYSLGGGGGLEGAAPSKPHPNCQADSDLFETSLALDKFDMNVAVGPFEAESERQPIAAVGGVIYRLRAGRPELLLIKKERGFWTLPKGRVRPGEND